MLEICEESYRTTLEFIQTPRILPDFSSLFTETVDLYPNNSATSFLLINFPASKLLVIPTLLLIFSFIF